MPEIMVREPFGFGSVLGTSLLRNADELNETLLPAGVPQIFKYKEVSIWQRQRVALGENNRRRLL